MITVSVDTSGLDRKTKRLIKNLQDYSEPLKKSADYLLKEVDTNFRKQGALFSSRGWKPLAESTREQRQRLGYGRARPVLIRTGKLRRGFEIVNRDRQSITLGNNVDYFKYHQLGGQKIPQRKMLDATARADNAIKLIFRRWIRDIAK